MTAQDFLYGYQRLLDPRIAAPYVQGYFDTTIAGASNYANVDPKNTAQVTSFINGLGLSAPDANTFVIKLSNPAGYFKWTVSLWLAAPERKDMVEKAGSSSYGAVNSAAVGTVIGNGPYMLSEVVPNEFNGVFSLDSGHRFFDIVLNDLGKIKLNSGKALELLFNFPNDAFLLHAARPVLSWLQIHEELGVEETCGICSVVGTPELRSHR